MPTDNLSLGLERVSMFKSLNKHWILGDNAESDDQWNDIGGIDLRYRFPGVQLYGSLYGEDQPAGSPVSMPAVSVCISRSCLAVTVAGICVWS